MTVENNLGSGEEFAQYNRQENLLGREKVTHTHVNDKELLT